LSGDRLGGLRMLRSAAGKVCRLPVSNASIGTAQAAFSNDGVFSKGGVHGVINEVSTICGDGDRVPAA